MIEYKRSNFKFILAVLGVLLLLFQVYVQMQNTVKRLDKENVILIEKNVQSTTQTIETKVGYAESRIRVIAHNIGMALTGPELPNPKYALALYGEKSPFSFIEYVGADGINILADGTKLNASDRVFYKEGMQGKSGIWANFTPAVAKEVLLNYYCPLRYNDQIVGVLTGVIGGDRGLKAYMKQDFFGEPCYNVLCHSNGRIITSNAGNNFGKNMEQLLLEKGIGKNESAQIIKAMANSSKKTLQLEQGDSYMLISLAEVKDLDSYVIQIVPEATITSLRKNALYSYYGIISALLLLFIIIGILYKYDWNMDKAVKKTKKELEINTAIAKMYHTVHVVDLSTDTAEEYMCTDSIRKLAMQKQKASEMIIFVMENLCKPEWKEQVLSFVDLSTLQSRLQEQDSIMLDFESVNVWVRSFFSVMERDKQGKVLKVIFATRVIDKYMKDLERLHRKSNVDQLTGLLNRRAYEDNLKEHEQVSLPQAFVLASIDVNGLKDVNDTLGHAAGDEMLKGAAACLERCLGSYGSVYRMGGDEFTAMLFVDDAKLKEIKQDLEATVRAWRGNLVHELHFACGFASKGEYPDADIKELSQIADTLMYEDKEHYYSQEGLDRRRKQYVFDTICSSYTKILRVNLTDDSYSIIRLDESELNDPKRPDKISVWLETFGRSAKVMEEDREKYLQATDLEKLRAFFKSKQNHYSFYYRRDIKGVFKYVMMEILAASDYTDEKQVVYLLVKDVGTTNL